MKTVSVDNNNARKILIALITSDDFARQYFDLFESKPIFKELGAKWIEKTCVEFYKKYNKATNKNIADLYEKAVQSKSVNAEELKFIDNILVSLSEESTEEETPVDFLIDLAIEESTRRELEAIRENLTVISDPNKAKELVENFHAVERGEKMPVTNFLEDEESVKEIFKPDAQPILHMPGDFGTEMSRLLHPGSFVLLRARAKVGKTYGAQTVILQALKEKKNVCVFQLGDLSKTQNLRRFWQMLTGKLVFPTNRDYYVPVLDCMKNMDNTCMNINRRGDKPYKNADGSYTKDYKSCSVCRGNKGFPCTVTHIKRTQHKQLLESDARKYQKMLKDHMGESKFNLYHFPAGKKSAQNIYDILEKDAEKGISYDLVVIDHCDQLAPSTKSKNQQNWLQVEETVMILRNISLDFNVALLVNDQSAKQSEEMNETGVGRGLAKDQYCTSTVMLSKTFEDRKNNITRLTVPAAREGTTVDNYMLIMNCLDEGSWCLDSYNVSDEDIEAIELYEKANNPQPKERRKK